MSESNQLRRVARALGWRVEHQTTRPCQACGETIADSLFIVRDAEGGWIENGFTEEDAWDDVEPHFVFDALLARLAADGYAIRIVTPTHGLEWTFEAWTYVKPKGQPLTLQRYEEYGPTIYAAAIAVGDAMYGGKEGSGEQ